MSEMSDEERTEKEIEDLRREYWRLDTEINRRIGRLAFVSKAKLRRKLILCTLILLCGVFFGSTCYLAVKVHSLNSLVDDLDNAIASIRKEMQQEANKRYEAENNYNELQDRLKGKFDLSTATPEKKAKKVDWSKVDLSGIYIPPTTHYYDYTPPIAETKTVYIDNTSSAYKAPDYAAEYEKEHQEREQRKRNRYINNKMHEDGY